MKNKLVNFLPFLALTFFILAGCSSETTSTGSVGDEKETDIAAGENTDNSDESKTTSEIITDVFKTNDQADWLTSELDSLVNNAVGHFAGETYEANREDIEAVLDQFPSQEDLDGYETEYMQKLMLLFGEDYEDPFPEWEEINVELPTIYNGARQLKPNLNVEILLDASGSMIEEIDGESKMALAKDAIKTFAGKLPEEAYVSLRVYGNEGTTAFADKEMSCQSSEQVYELQSYDEGTLNNALEQFEPAGWTPMAKALKDAMKDLEGLDGETHTNFIFLVSDGVGTCDGDPVKVASELKESNIQPIVNVIGFDVDEEGENQLKAVAESADGLFAYVEDQEALQEQFEKTDEIAAQWKKWRSETLAEINEISSRRSERLSTVMSDWNENRDRERDNINAALDYLSEKGKIDTSHFNSYGNLMDIRYRGLHALFFSTKTLHNSKNFSERVGGKAEVKLKFFDR
ncbi:VWA domain-containing protein [Aureibacillus halotolerans]|uniref:Ca-activated chloride channel family protein n=1 Tax=Aureibacillus halotolerans TaxID=1508390 RepID=A0A4R6UDZ5_9BACI|nr:VWA domain-containing protein [Aureibacillus halotolerans]TDQ43035.1 Ca-activated chloride channel family protein [Aureibacillus halotolerans]